MNVTLETLKEHQAALIEKFGADAKIAFAGVSMSQLSIARLYGGCKVNGHSFIYNPTDDSLIREDVVKWMAKRTGKKEKKK